MRLDKDQALKLRLSGKSYNQISNLLKIPKSTLSVWLKDVPLSEKAKSVIKSRTNELAVSKLIERNKNQTVLASQRHEVIYKQATKEAKNLLDNPLFITGVSLYWAEGYKKGWTDSKWKSIDFANADSEMIAIMMLFFKKFLNIKEYKIKIQIMLHDEQNSQKALDYWRNITKVPKENFFKPCCVISKASNGKIKNKLEYGTVHIRINDVQAFFRLAGWIDSLKAKFI
ncbi:MAG: hypothetical protein HY931_02945 [Candidatus Falkowbacteria bacterium]|nr:MAG: hypothetical protein HY931_02945 [Candidatus Falkowbacteria bacterium]